MFKKALKFVVGFYVIILLMILGVIGLVNLLFFSL